MHLTERITEVIDGSAPRDVHATRACRTALGRCDQVLLVLQLAECMSVRIGEATLEVVEVGA